MRSTLTTTCTLTALFVTLVAAKPGFRVGVGPDGQPSRRASNLNPLMRAKARETPVHTLSVPPVKVVRVPRDPIQEHNPAAGPVVLPEPPARMIVSTGESPCS